MHTGIFRHIFAGLTAFAALGCLTLGLAPVARAQAIHVLADFTGTPNGAEPFGPVTVDSQGNLFGTTYGGGNAQNDGTVWEIPYGTSTLTTVASFAGGAGGANPSGNVAFDSSGNLFGVTYKGGDANGDGTVWEIAAGTNTILTLAAFAGGAGGSSPHGGVTLDSHGNLLGTTVSGGAFGNGTVWEMLNSSRAITILASFHGLDNTETPYAGTPEGGVTIDSVGNLYGDTVYGGRDPVSGVNQMGTVWEMAVGTTTITTLASFNGVNGEYPEGNVALDSHGNLYGTADGGGSAKNAGTIWELPAGANTLTTLGVFTGTNGGGPEGGATLDGSGNLFGTTYDGGSDNIGTVWELAAGASAITLLGSFTGGGTVTGRSPTAGLTLDNYGNLYGTASGGGSGNAGVVFSLSGFATPLTRTSRAHLLWNNVNGQAALWTINPDTTYASVVYGPFSGWTARATAAASDGTNWLLWTNTNGTAALWHVTALTASGYTATQYGPYAGYTAVSLSVGSDGSPHILWNKTDGTALLWTVNPANGSFTYTTYGPYSGWTANAVASGNTVTDLLWTNTNGTADGYRIAANGSLTQHTFGPYAGYAAKSLSVGPDDGAHLLWDKTDGTALLWNVDFSSGAFTYTSYGPFSGYAARAIATGPDNVSHILWDATNGTASLWNVMGSSYTYHAYGPFAGWTAVGVSAGP